MLDHNHVTCRARKADLMKRKLGIVRVLEAEDQESLQQRLTEASPVERPVKAYGRADEPWIQPEH